MRGSFSCSSRKAGLKRPPWMTAMYALVSKSSIGPELTSRKLREWLRPSVSGGIGNRPRFLCFLYFPRFFRTRAQKEHKESASTSKLHRLQAAPARLGIR